MKVPEDRNLDVSVFGRLFHNTTNSYKYFWFLAVLDLLKGREGGKLDFEEIFHNMVLRSWYPVVTYRLSFGKQDRLEPLIREIEVAYCQEFKIPDYRIEKYIEQELPKNRDYLDRITRFNRYVPDRFLSPFVDLRGVKDGQKNSLIEEAVARDFLGDNPPFYRITRTGIELHPLWLRYFKEHLPILEGFTRWHLSKYLQKRNPGVPGIIEKLDKPRIRNLVNATKFWKMALRGMEPRCIYSGREIREETLSIDHFLPWSFVAHDLIWNTIPTPRDVNSSKSDNLPDLGIYLPRLVDTHYEAVRVVADSRDELLDDHVQLTRTESVHELTQLGRDEFGEHMEQTIRPQYSIARRLGFRGGWTFG